MVIWLCVAALLILTHGTAQWIAIGITDATGPQGNADSRFYWFYPQYRCGGNASLTGPTGAMGISVNGLQGYQGNMGNVGQQG